MNIVNTLTLRHIKTHKKRSILTILAIIVSVAMVTAVFTSAISFVKYFQNVAKAVDGTWHSCVYTDDFNSKREILDKYDIEKYGVDIGYGAGVINTNGKDNGFSINACDENYLELRNVKVSEGRMPSNTHEMLVHRGFVDKNKLDWKIGDKINIPVEFYDVDGNYIENKQFTIVGITDSNVFETDITSAFVYATDDCINNNEVSVDIKFSKLDKSVFDKSEEINFALNDKDTEHNVSYNNMLLTYSGVTTEDETLIILGGFCAIILAIIAIVSIFIIYDSFAISYQERARYLGMLASVGATKKQKRKSIYFEGLILGLIGIPLGILAGIGGIWLTFKGIDGVWAKTLAVEYNGALRVYVNWIVILGTVLASAITIFVSSYIPALKASKTTAIDAIRQVNTVKVKNSKRLRTSKLATKMLGFEGAMAIKNFKRNGRRSRNIVFALFMSVVVFLSVANFSLMFSSLMKSNYSENADLIATVQYKDYKKLDKVIADADGVDDKFGIDLEYALFDTSLINADAKELFSNDQVILAFVDNATLDNYLRQLGADTAPFHDVNNPKAILHNTALTRDEKKRVKINPIADIEGKKLDTTLMVFDPETGIADTKLKIDPQIAIQTTEDYKNDKFYFQDMHLPLVMMSIDVAEHYFSQSDILETEYSVYITSEETELLEEQIKTLTDVDYLSVINSSSEMEAINNILTIVKVFVFGFIALITLISIINIINTISNSMNERRREFAMIRSVGMTPKSFKKMVYYESFRYGILSLLWSVPISIAIHYGMYYVLSQSYDYGFVPHPWIYLVAGVGVFAVICIALVYSFTKIKDDNIIETLKNDIN